MQRQRETVAGRTRDVGVGALAAHEMRRNLGRRFVLPLIAASLIAVCQIALVRPQARTEKPFGATPEPTINVPAFVRPPGPSPGVLTGGRVRIGVNRRGGERHVIAVTAARSERRLDFSA